MAVYNPYTNRGGVPERHQLGQVDPNSRQYRRDNFVVDPWHKFSPEIEEHGGAVAPTIYVGRDENKWTDKSRRYFEENPNWKHSAFYRDSIKPPAPEPTPIPPAPQAPIQNSIQAEPTPVPQPPAPTEPAQAQQQPPQQPQQPQQIPKQSIPWTTGSGQYNAMGVNSGLFIGNKRDRFSAGGFFGRGGPRLISNALTT